MTDQSKQDNNRKKPSKNKPQAEGFDDSRVEELTLDLQRTRADFENYRKRMESDKLQARADGKMAAIMSLIPVIDSMERAIVHIPEDLADHPWVKGISGLTKQLDKTLATLELARIEAVPDTPFNPDMHDAIQIDEDADGESEVIAEELQAGYTLSGQVVRPALVKVTRK